MNLKQQILFVWFLFSPLFATIPEWPLKNSHSGWNCQAHVSTYFHNSELQRQWAWELIGKIDLKGNEKVLDFGCGDGKITAELSRLLSKGSILGIDISSEMQRFAKIKFPRYAFPNLDFEKSNLLLEDDRLEKFDLIVSFSTLHLIEQNEQVLKNLKNNLNDEGRIALLIPVGNNEILLQAASQVFKDYYLHTPWESNISSPSMNVLTTDGCRKSLQECGFKVASVELIDTDNPFYNEDELVTWLVGTMGPNWNIPVGISHDFFGYVVQKMKELDPEMIDEEGRIHFKFSRIHALASVQTSL